MGNVSDVQKLLEEIGDDDLMDLMREMGISSASNGKAKRTYNPSLHSTVKQYTSVTRHYTCLVCGYKWSTTHQFHKGETVRTVNPDGTVDTHYIRRDGDELNLTSSTSHCCKCEENVKTWERDKLERVFLTLLKSVSAYHPIKEEVC